eukprot:763779-Hanusia_phi.AAC.1
MAFAPTEYLDPMRVLASRTFVNDRLMLRRNCHSTYQVDSPRVDRNLALSFTAGPASAGDIVILLND